MTGARNEKSAQCQLKVHFVAGHSVRRGPDHTATTTTATDELVSSFDGLMPILTVREAKYGHVVGEAARNRDAATAP